MSLHKKIKNKNAHIGVIGLGYVGLPLAVEFAKAGFNVTGIEIDENKISAINNGGNYISDIDDSLMIDSVRTVNIRLFATGWFQLVEIPQLLSGCICQFLTMTSRPVHTSLVRAASPLLLIMCPLISMHYISHWFLRVKLMSNALVPLHSSAGFSYVHQLH